MIDIKQFLKDKYHKLRLDYEILKLDRYRKNYSSYDFNFKKKMSEQWLILYPEQANFDLIPVNYLFENLVNTPCSVLEIGGWRGDLALRILNNNDIISQWHNYDLLDYNRLQKCSDPRYRLITLHNYVWNTEPVSDYNILISTHMIEHINWKEFKELAAWIPSRIETVLFEAPLSPDDENFNWKGDYSSHVLEKGWKQVNAEMSIHGFNLEYTLNNTVIYKR
jgi:hypothetical protein